MTSTTSELIAKKYIKIHTLRETALWEHVVGTNADIEPTDRDRAREKRVRPIIVSICSTIFY